MRKKLRNSTSETSNWIGVQPRGSRTFPTGDIYRAEFVRLVELASALDAQNLTSPLPPTESLTLLAMSRVWLLLLCATLLVWRPLDFAIEFLSTLSSLGQRGAAGVVEVLVHGAVAALAVAAVRALTNAMPSGLLLARSALLASVAATIQSFYWSVLPHQTMPGDKLPLSILAVVVAGGWLVYLRRHHDVVS